MFSAAHVIFTKYLPPTDTRGARITAKFSFGLEKVTIPFPYELDHDERHEAAAKALILKRNPALRLVSCGEIPLGMVFTANHGGAS